MALSDIIIFIVIAALMAYLLINNFKLRRKTESIASKYLQEALDKQSVLDKLAEVLDAQQTKTMEESDGFVKFLSQSRDWAYKYIEDTQVVIADFVSTVDSEIESVNNQKISEAYDKLKDVLPKEE